MTDSEESKTLSSQKEIYNECMKNDSCKATVLNGFASKHRIDKTTTVFWTISKIFGIGVFVFFLVVITWFLYIILTQGTEYLQTLFGSIPSF